LLPQDSRGTVSNRPESISSGFAPSGLELGPSAYAETELPFLARELGFKRDIIQKMENLKDIKEVDSYVLSLVTERKLTDTKESYQSILKELYKVLGMTRLHDPFYALEKLHSGIKLLRRQAELRRLQREVDIQLTKPL
jgi:hypothetical protein